MDEATPSIESPTIQGDCGDQVRAFTFSTMAPIILLRTSIFSWMCSSPSAPTNVSSWIPWLSKYCSNVNEWPCALIWNRRSSQSSRSKKTWKLSLSKLLVFWPKVGGRSASLEPFAQSPRAIWAKPFSAQPSICISMCASLLFSVSIGASTLLVARHRSCLMWLTKKVTSRRCFRIVSITLIAMNDKNGLNISSLVKVELSRCGSPFMQMRTSAQILPSHTSTTRHSD
mmetsp:Transcript_169811/g.545031  ORF Transcript_169811/g.545031 Transcript_169811/m.545031 type:complete len:228 (+) Transcript_169811:1466-2149(+)